MWARAKKPTLKKAPIKKAYKAKNPTKAMWVTTHGLSSST